MICEECGKNQATVSVTVSAGGEMRTRHLCPECMSKMQLSLVSGDIQGFLGSILAMMNAQKKSDAPKLTCSSCGLTYETFQQTGRLGCAHCYHDFADELKPLLERIHGRVQHAGRRPSTFHLSPEDEKQQRMQQLRHQMDEAVEQENFEDAAKYRDQLRALMQEEEAAGE